MAASAPESGAATAFEVFCSARNQPPPRVLAVGKTKPVSAIKEVHDAGHRHFGESYVQEITEKAPELPDDIRWHFTGLLQSNKAEALVAGVPNLYMVDSIKVANYLDRAMAEQGRPPLRVLVQVNTSGEESKFGVEPGSDCLELARHVKLECSNLSFSGLMTMAWLTTPQHLLT